MQLPISYCVKVSVSMTTYIFINFFQTEYFSVVNFDIYYEKNKGLSFSCDTNTSINLEKIEKIRLGSF